MWHGIFQFVAAHQVLSATVSYYVYSALCQALPAPDTKSGKFYQFFFKSCHNIAGNWRYAMRRGVPSTDEDRES